MMRPNDQAIEKMREIAMLVRVMRARAEEVDRLHAEIAERFDAGDMPGALDAVNRTRAVSRAAAPVSAFIEDAINSLAVIDPIAWTTAHPRPAAPPSPTTQLAEALSNAFGFRVDSVELVEASQDIIDTMDVATAKANLEGHKKICNTKGCGTHRALEARIRNLGGTP